MKVIVITGCQAGVAHSKMVSAVLKKELESRGFEVSTEEHGGMGGSPQRVNAAFAKEADLVILATAIRIMGMERFKHLPVFKVDIHKALMKPKEVVDEALAMYKELKK